MTAHLLLVLLSRVLLGEPTTASEEAIPPLDAWVSGEVSGDTIPILISWAIFDKLPEWLDWQESSFRACRTTSRSVGTAGSRRSSATMITRRTSN